MKLFVVAFICVIGVNALSDKEEWLTFKQNHGKVYKNIVEENYRFSVFQSNLREINEHNERYRNGETTYFLGVNKFADRTPAEFRSMWKTKEVDLPKREKAESRKRPKRVNAIETAVDWRTKGVVLPVRDQGDCGNTWPFAVAAAFESQNAIINNITVQLSPQQLIDCAVPFGEECKIGGVILNGFYYGMDTTIMPESEYPFRGNQAICRADPSKGIVHAYGVQFSVYTEDELQEDISTLGPMASTINADCIQLYAGGVYSNSSCPNTPYDINFAVLTVGYNTTDDGIDYWIIKNSWGTSWGEEGYLRLRRGNLELGINLSNAVPLIDQN